MTAQIIFRDDPYQKNCTAKVTFAEGNVVRLSQTIFYPTGGGQPGDTGTISWNGNTVQITDTRKHKAENAPEDINHILADNSPLPQVGDEVEINLDWSRRYAHMRMHSCMHILSSLFKDAAVTGGQVGSDKSRLDFDMQGMETPDKELVTEELNKIIAASHPIEERWITDDELLAQPELVRTMSVKPPMGHGRVRLLAIGNGVDLQPCGGTHVRNTSEIGQVEVIKIENKGKQNRRIIVALQ